tara:strand:+ start:634 stop:900 length:267 start_codon:yes stop_codon:yes gene_type:complete
MKKKEIKDIISFIDNTMVGCELEYTHTIGDDSIIVSINGLFDTASIEYKFKIIDNKINFFSITGKYIPAEVSVFWLEMTAKIQNIITK